MKVVGTILIVIGINLLRNGYGQDLIPNYSFENYKFCPKNYSSYSNYLKKCLGNWYSPTRGTPDYFSSCNKYDAGVPKNHAGYSESLHGTGYVGFILACNPSLVFSKVIFTQEYLATELQHPLIRGTSYCIEFYISLADYSLFTTDVIGVHFSRKKIKKRTKENLPFEPQVVFKENRINSDSCWVKLSKVFIAEGGEKYLAIGNFQKPYEIKYRRRELKIRKQKIIDHAYYYIDAVSLYPAENGCRCEEDFTY